MELSLEYLRRLASGNEGVDVEFKETTGQFNRGMETLCGIHWGRGLSMMARECEHVGLPAPEFTQDGVIVKTIFTRPDSPSDSTGKDTVGVSKSKLGVIRSTVEISSLKPAFIKLVKVVGEDWFSSYELCEILSYRSRNSFVRQYLNPAVDMGLMTLENPASPNAPNQRYGLTTKGKALYYEQKKGLETDPQTDPQNDLEGQLNPQIDPQKIPADPQKAKILGAIKENPSISRIELAVIAGCSESTIKRRLKEWNIAWLGHPKTGHWVEIKKI